MNTDYTSDFIGAWDQISNGPLTHCPSAIASLRIAKHDKWVLTTLVKKDDLSERFDLDTPGALRHYPCSGISKGWSVEVNLKPLVPLGEDETVSPFLAFKNLSARIASISAAPMREIEAESAIHGDKIDIWNDQWRKSGGSDMISYHGGLIDIALAEGLNTVGLELYDRLAGETVAYQALTALSLLLPDIMLDHTRRALVMTEIRKFCDHSKTFHENYRIYLSFRKQVEATYQNAFRLDPDGKPDLSKVVRELTRFLKREAVSIMQSYDEEEAAAGIASICALSLGRRPEPIHTRGISYEKEVAERLSKLGYDVETTPITGDFGADLIAEKDELRYALQCKSYVKPVGVKAVQEAAGSRRYYKCDFAVVVSMSGFTAAAQELSIELGVLLASDSSLDRLETITMLV
ncbi:restriction endonuclease [Mesorhizobium sp. M8A.F.Ca.ET.207.01.1.1]|uniref:restriction endonuclease n=1 Tax=Mesorhizobium sp. M8A.F.Ca.ET.207.01.1.1 TaxID=2563968 RepID=UPI00109C57D1|nr:restriction endonuclease [Mesorhizobium sp. M8A.F.Ca.ET.207.01.1.1]TGQ83741.1 restriction endonuclease [Mesorhizobium sp. M8A.F.Ca.ET.207.01.1.1]